MATQLQLHTTKVRLAFPDKAGHDPAPQGTHVWLDVPTGTIRNFSFQEFVVNAQGTLDPAGANRRATIDRTVTYWSMWTAPGATGLTMPTSFNADELNVVSGFGRPLLAVVNSQTELVLPNTRKVIIREFNMTAHAREPATMNDMRQGAIDFYKDLHIEVDFQKQPKPRGQPNVFVKGGARGGTGTTVHNVTQIRASNPPVVSLPLDQAPFPPPSADKPKTILLIWVHDFLNTGVDGHAHHPGRFLSNAGVTVTSPSIPAAVDFSVIFMNSKGSFKFGLAHEIGHVLWADVGDGKQFYEDTQNQLTERIRTRYRAAINDVFIKHMGLDIPPANVVNHLNTRDHSPLANNLMNSMPANTGTGDQLTFTQVGAFRLAPELRWDPAVVIP